MKYNSIKLEYKIVSELIERGSSVLELGCGNGDLLSVLVRKNNIKAQGIEFDEQAIYKCVAKRLSVFHGDIDSGLTDYEDKLFDYVILIQNLQKVKEPDIVLKESLRVGKKVIISFPNFAHYKVRLQIFLKGQTPVTPSLPYEWYNTPNLHFLSIFDFLEYCNKKKIKIEKAFFIKKERKTKILPNLFAETGIFLISKTPAQP